MIGTTLNVHYLPLINWVTSRLCDNTLSMQPNSTTGGGRVIVG